MKDAIILFSILGTIAVLNFCFGYCMAERRYQEQAIVHNAAEYVAKNQTVSWRWKDCK